MNRHDDRQTREYILAGRSARYRPALTTALWVAALCCITHPAWLALVAAASSALVVAAAGAMATNVPGRRAALRRRIVALGHGAGSALAAIGLALLLSGILRSALHLVMLDDVPAIELHRATTTVLAGGAWIWLTCRGVRSALTSTQSGRRDVTDFPMGSGAR